jgi:hypothetical protein
MLREETLISAYNRSNTRVYVKGRNTCESSKIGYESCWKRNKKVSEEVFPITGHLLQSTVIAEHRHAPAVSPRLQPL